MTGGAEWRRSDAARSVVLAYCLELRAALRAIPRACRYLRRCAVCRLFFMVDPRNAWRDCVCCPYGCRTVRDRQRSNERVRAYYRTDAGKRKKRALNRARSLRAAPARRSETPSPPAEDELAPEVVTHVQVVISLFEGRRVARDEIISLLERILRQRHIGGRPSRGYGALRMEIG